MKIDFYYASSGKGQIHACKWIPEVEPRGVVQLVHGIAEHSGRYNEFAHFLNAAGFVVVAEDHMGHGESAKSGTQGFFYGGWFAAVQDICCLMDRTRAEFPDLPYILFGHSMGSFLVRTILAQYPDRGYSGAIICGTAWMPNLVVAAGLCLSGLICALRGADSPSKLLDSIIFGGYNKKIDHPQTSFDWLSRNRESVIAYIEDPLCGFMASAGLLRDMMKGIQFIQNRKNRVCTKKNLPVYLIAGQEDPVGAYGTGVARTQREFQKDGMKDVTLHLYPECRHEILQENNRKEVFLDILVWLEKKGF